MDVRASLGAVLQNHLLSPDIEAQVVGAAIVDLLPAHVIQVLGQREMAVSTARRRSSPKLEVKEGELIAIGLRSGGNLQILLGSARPYLIVKSTDMMPD